LMKHRDVAVILATGGMGLVRAAYSAGKPAYGVGPGNAPAFIERTANVKKAVHDCHYRQDVRQRRALFFREFRRSGRADRRGREAGVRGSGRLLHEQGRTDAVARLLVTPQAPAQSGPRRQGPPFISPGSPGLRCRRRHACSWRRSTGSAASIPYRSRSCARFFLITS